MAHPPGGPIAYLHHFTGRQPGSAERQRPHAGPCPQGASTSGVVQRLFMPRSPASDTIRAASEALPDDRLELLDVVVETEADLHGDLEVADRLIGEVATDVGDFEPVKMMQRLRRPSRTVADGVVHAVGR